MRNCAVKILVVNTPWQTVQRWKSVAAAESHFHSRLSRSVAFYTFGPDADNRRMIVPRNELAAIVFEEIDDPAEEAPRPVSPRAVPAGLASAVGRTLAAVPKAPAPGSPADDKAGGPGADAPSVDA